MSLLLNLFLEEVSWRCSVRNIFLISLQSFFCQYETLLKQVFSEIFKNNVLLVHLQVTGSSFQSNILQNSWGIRNRYCCSEAGVDALYRKVISIKVTCFYRLEHDDSLD